MTAGRPGPRPRGRGRGPTPLRTCLGCRRVRPQAELVRLVRQADGSVEPAPRRDRGGRGAYLCRRPSCLDEAVRRGRWAHAFRAPAVLRPETIARVRALIQSEPEPGRPAPSEHDGELQPAALGAERAAERSEGRG